jgi:thioredoxin 1
MASAAAALTDQTFDEVIGGSDVPVIVEFWAEWCGPCKMLGPLLDDIVAEQGERIALYKVDSDEDPALVARFGVASVPTTLVFVRGELVKRMVGARGKRQLVEELAGVLA